MILNMQPLTFDRSLHNETPSYSTNKVICNATIISHKKVIVSQLLQFGNTLKTKEASIVKIFRMNIHYFLFRVEWGETVLSYFCCNTI